MLSYLNIVENIDIKEVIAMQISGYSSAAMLAYRSSGMKQKAGTVKMQDFSSDGTEHKRTGNKPNR